MHEMGREFRNFQHLQPSFPLHISHSTYITIIGSWKKLFVQRKTFYRGRNFSLRSSSSFAFCSVTFGRCETFAVLTQMEFKSTGKYFYICFSTPATAFLFLLCSIHFTPPKTFRNIKYFPNRTESIGRSKKNLKMFKVCP